MVTLGIISGDREERDTAEMHGSILRWLSSGELLNAVTTSMSELLEVTDQVKGKEKGTDTLKHTVYVINFTTKTINFHIVWSLV